MRRSLALALLVAALGCRRAPAGPADAGSGPSVCNRGGDFDGGAAASWRSSLAVCWTDGSCPRALALAHGGEWGAAGAPYDSNGALAAAFADGSDAVKIDVRVTLDDVPVIAHSSPIQVYESTDCAGQKIEEMTAAQVTQCHRVPSKTETFQRLDDVLRCLGGKLVAQLTVKLPTDYARTIAEVLALGAQDFAVLEISTSDLQTLIPTISGWDQVYYLVNVGTTLSDVDLLLGTIKSPRAFMYEFDPSVQLGTLPATRLHPAGVRSFTYTNASTVTVQDLQALYDAGYDVVSSNYAAEEVQARILVNQARGVSPP